MSDLLNSAIQDINSSGPSVSDIPSDSNDFSLGNLLNQVNSLSSPSGFSFQDNSMDQASIPFQPPPQFQQTPMDQSQPPFQPNYMNQSPPPFQPNYMNQSPPPFQPNPMDQSPPPFQPNYMNQSPPPFQQSNNPVSVIVDPKDSPTGLWSIGSDGSAQAVTELPMSPAPTYVVPNIKDLLKPGEQIVKAAQIPRQSAQIVSGQNISVNNIVPYCDTGAISASNYQTNQCVCNPTSNNPVLRTGQFEKTTTDNGIFGTGFGKQKTTTKINGYWCSAN